MGAPVPLGILVIQSRKHGHFSVGGIILLRHLVKLRAQIMQVHPIVRRPHKQLGFVVLPEHQPHRPQPATSSETMLSTRDSSSKTACGSKGVLRTSRSRSIK